MGAKSVSDSAVGFRAENGTVVDVLIDESAGKFVQTARGWAWSSAPASATL